MSFMNLDKDVTIAEPGFIMAAAAAVVEAYVANNQVHVSDLPALIRSVAATLTDLSSGAPAKPAEATRGEPAVSIKKSVTPEFIICLEDGAKLKMLKRYLRTHFDLTPEQYRARWDLPRDYPMVAPNYATMRSDMAKKIGLGRKAQPQGRGRKKKAA